MAAGVRVSRKGSALRAAILRHREFEQLPEKHARGAAVVASQLAPRSSIDTPGYVHMADSIFAKKVTRTRWTVIVDKFYAIYVELGTIFQDAQPFFRPAMASAIRAFRRDLKALVNRVVR